MQQEIDYAALDEILERNQNDKQNIISILQETQSIYNYLPREIFPYYAKKLDISSARIYGVATFYENFSLEPKGRHLITICDGTACHVRHSIPVIEQIRKELGLTPEQVTTKDMMFTLETVSCLGACGLAPVLTLDGEVHAAMTPQKATELIKKVREEDNKNESD